MKRRKVITPKAKRPAEKNGIFANSSSTCVGQPENFIRSIRIDTHRKIFPAALQDQWSEPVRERDRDVVRDMVHDRARDGGSS